jgi:hypothetical protein
MTAGRLLMVSALFVGFPEHSLAADSGTAAEAKAMLDKVVAGLKTDKAGTLAKISKGEAGGFKDRDLYPFCGGPDGNYTAHGLVPNLVLGKSLKDVKDKAGKPIGEEMYGAAKEGKVSEISYVWPSPGSSDPVPKVAFFTRVGDQLCGVGYHP